MVLTLARDLGILSPGVRRDDRREWEANLDHGG
jgi:hypothetical protein